MSNPQPNSIPGPKVESSRQFNGEVKNAKPLGRLVKWSRREAISIVLGTFVYGAISSKMARADATKTKPAMTYTILPFGQILPRGWILQQMKEDLDKGIAGNIETYFSHLTRQWYIHQNLTPGLFDWWSAEEEGYWLDGVTRMAICTGDTKRLDKVRAAYDAILAKQASDPTGYIGVYDAASRYNNSSPNNAELWTKSRMFQGMLAFYEFTGEQKYLEAVKKAVALDMEVYGKVNYFERPLIKSGAVPHAIGYFDTLDYLWRITGDRSYLDFAVKFYGDFNGAFANKESFLSDLVVSNLADPALKLICHTPHVCEGWYVPALALAVTGSEDFRRAVNVGDEKLRYHTCPGGGVVGDERIEGRPGTGFMDHEYCGMTELISSFNRRLQYVGQLADADAAEKVALNDCQGGRFQEPAVAIQYLSRANRKEVPANLSEKYQYRPVHKAGCCVLNAARTMPYYLEGFWFRTETEPGLAAMRYGPSVLKTSIGTSHVQIEQETMYPFGDDVTFHITVDQPSNFLLQLRVPGGAKEMAVDCPSGVTKQQVEGVVQLRGTWKTGDIVTMKCKFPVEVETSNDGEKYYRRGPLLFAAKFDHTAVKTTQLQMEGGPLVDFWDYQIDCSGSTAAWDFRMDPASSFQLVALPEGDPLRPFAAPPMGLKGTMRDPTGKPVEVTLVPFGATVLRRATFPA